MMEQSAQFQDISHPIVERCKKGDNNAFKELYDLYAKAMFNTAFRIVNNTEDAQELLQDSFLKAFSQIRNFDNRYSFGVWLKRILINKSIDALKKRRVNTISIDFEVETADEPHETDDEACYNVDLIKFCIKKLPDGYRTILSLILFEDYSHKEVSELLKISEGTSKSQYNRAKRKLIELLKQNTVAK